MTTYLLDVNVLIALFDRAHIGHEAAHRWFAGKGSKRWATCPTTENGLIRVLTNPAYPNVEVSAEQVREHLQGLITNQPNHCFWPDDVSLTDTSRFRLSHLQGHRQLTDAYLLGLCKHHGGKLATMDKRVSVTPIAGGNPALVELLVP